MVPKRFDFLVSFPDYIFPSVYLFRYFLSYFFLSKPVLVLFYYLKFCGRLLTILIVVPFSNLYVFFVLIYSFLFYSFFRISSAYFLFRDSLARFSLL